MKQVFVTQNYEISTHVTNKKALQSKAFLLVFRMKVIQQQLLLPLPSYPSVLLQ